MCGRYALHANPEVIALQFGLDAVPDFAPRYNIAPATEVLVVRDGNASLAHWGLRRKFANLRAETLAQKFPGPYRNGRALVPASGFYEWQSRAGRKQPYYFFPADGALLALAAVWENDSFSLITTSRMRRCATSTTACRSSSRAMTMARGSRATKACCGRRRTMRLKVHPVGMAVNQAANDSPRLLEPVELARGLFD